MVDSRPGELSCGVAFSGGPLLLVEFVCDETQEDHLSEVSRKILSDLESMTMEQVVAQLQQELCGCRIWTRRCSVSRQLKFGKTLLVSSM